MTVSDLQTEYPAEKGNQFVDVSLSVVYAMQLLQAVNQFDQLDK